MEANELRTIMFGFNFHDKLANGQPNFFQHKEMREAVALAIDLNLIRDKVMRAENYTEFLAVIRSVQPAPYRAG